MLADYPMTSSHDTLIHRLGYGGLLPFVGLALLLWLVEPDLLPFVAIALAGYGAVIVSFLGGIHWGVAFQPEARLTPLRLVWGVVPSLLAWVALLMPPASSLPFLGLILIACYAVDRATYPAAGMGRWLGLRLHLTLVATLSCMVGAAAV